MTVHLGLCLLVVVNLLFVHITGVVDVAWVLAFSALTLLAPLLRRFTETLPYRLAWNTAVLVLFVSLVNRTLLQGVGRMLEGGLILAVFCQVHLVNNVGTRQRPDLLLFNSFLIAIITAFFCQELAYSLVFVAYTFTLLIVWRVLTHHDSGGSTPMPRVVAEGARHALVVLALTGAVFAVWPRDFDRQGFVGDRFLQASGQTAGTADEIRLANKFAPVQSDRVVMRVRGNDVPTHWRASTFSLLEQGSWHATTTTQDVAHFGQTARVRSLDPPWHEAGRGRWQRRAGTARAPLRVELLDIERGRLCLPMDAARVVLSGDAVEVPHIPLADGTIAFFANEAGDDWERIEYEVACADDVAPASRWTPAHLTGCLGLDPTAVPSEALELAREVRASLPGDAPAAALAAALCARLRDGFAYGLPGQAQSARSLREFFRVRRGHCEFFASALAIMLRAQRVPCRLVGGYLATERERDGTVVVRARHAHAWVEVFDPERGWYALDPTPAQAETVDSETWLGALLASAEAVWSTVTGFDEQRRARAVQWLVALPGRAAAAAAAHPASCAALAAALVCLWYLRRRRPPDAVREYRRALRLARLTLASGETPRQLMERALSGHLPARVLDRLRAATERHERARYGQAGWAKT